MVCVISILEFDNDLIPPIMISTVMKPVASPKIEWTEIFGKIDGLRLITHLVKFLLKLSKIEGDKNFSKRGKVDVINFRPLIRILLIYMAQ